MVVDRGEAFAINIIGEIILFVCLVLLIFLFSSEPTLKVIGLLGFKHIYVIYFEKLANGNGGFPA